MMSSEQEDNTAKTLWGRRTATTEPHLTDSLDVLNRQQLIRVIHSRLLNEYLHSFAGQQFDDTAVNIVKDRVEEVISNLGVSGYEVDTKKTLVTWKDLYPKLGKRIGAWIAYLLFKAGFLKSCYDKPTVLNLLFPYTHSSSVNWLKYTTDLKYKWLESSDTGSEHVYSDAFDYDVALVDSTFISEYIHENEPETSYEATLHMPHYIIKSDIFITPAAELKSIALTYTIQ